MQRLPRSDARYQISKPPEGFRESAVAAATRRGTPRVGLLSSAFEGSEDHDGTVIPGLSSPAPLDAQLSDPQWEDLVRRTMQISGPVDRGFDSVIGRDEWILVLVELSPVAAASTDPRVVRGVLGHLLEKERGRRYTIAAALPIDSGEPDLWHSDWGGAFGGATYRDVSDRLSAEHPETLIELEDLAATGAIPMHVRGRPLAGGLRGGMISVALPFQRSDSTICIAPLKTHPEMGAGLGFSPYLHAAARSAYGPELAGLAGVGTAAEIAVELFAFRPAAIVVLGGGWASEGDGSAVRHNLLVAGTRAVPVGAVAAAAMGFQPAQLEPLHLAGKKGFNSEELDAVTDYTWIRGNEISPVKRVFRKPSAWKPYAAAS